MQACEKQRHRMIIRFSTLSIRLFNVAVVVVAVVMCLLQDSRIGYDLVSIVGSFTHSNHKRLQYIYAKLFASIRYCL